MSTADVEIRGWLPAADVVPAERAILGVLITGRSTGGPVYVDLDAADFVQPAHQIIYEAISRLAEAGGEVTPSTVLTELTRTREISKVGGGGYLHTLMKRGESHALAANVRRVRNDALRRRTAQAGAAIQQLAGDPGFDAETYPDEARRQLDAALATAKVDAPVTSGDLFLAALERHEHPESTRGLPTLPWADMRALMPVLRPGQLITVGARPGVGKSLWASDVARHAGLHCNIPAILFSLEMPAGEVTDRMLAAESMIPLHLFQTSKLDEREWDRIAHVRDRFMGGKLVVDDTPGIGLGHIRARLRGMARKEPAGLAIVDYLQLMRGAQGADTREREVAALAAGIKNIAREFHIPVIMVAQLNRGPESRGDRRPVKSDFRESGAIENESDVVILIHREDVTDRSSPRAGEADFIVDKNRAGPTATVTVAFQGHYGRFADMAPVYARPPGEPWTPSTTLNDGDKHGRKNHNHQPQPLGKGA
ncbi:MAG TPA: replicative DNA helicase [Streptosporangiaceae bacterium]|nr:replicative DNA helicase [Streptosporangiaceae bacterium]